MRSGGIGLDYGWAWSVGYDDYGWSRVSQSTTTAYNLFMNPTDVYPSNNSNRWVGFPLRASTIFHLPLAFVRSGNSGQDAGQFRNIGSISHGWSRVSRSATYAYRLDVNPTNVNPSFSYYRWLGFPLRYFIIVQLPLAFVRSGYINANDGRLRYVGDRGYDWAFTAASATNAYELGIVTTEVGVSNSSSRWHGFPLR